MDATVTSLSLFYSSIRGTVAHNTRTVSLHLDASVRTAALLKWVVWVVDTHSIGLLRFLSVV
jgi:hypothetical protein